MSKETIGAVGGESWTASDSTLIDRPTRGFQVTVAGNVALGYPDGSTCIWPACVAGMVHGHNGFNRVLSTGTTATGIVIAY